MADTTPNYKATPSTTSLSEQASAAIEAGGNQTRPQDKKNEPKGIMDILKGMFVNSNTGEIDILKVGLMAGGGALAALLGGGLQLGMIGTILLGAAGAFGASQLAPMVSRMFTGSSVTHGPQAVISETHLTPIAGFAKSQELTITPPSGVSAKPVTFDMPAIDTKINPKPELGLEQVLNLRDTAKNQDITNADRTLAAGNARNAQVALDTWVLTLSSLDQPMRRYNSEREKIVSHLESNFKLTREEAQSLVPAGVEPPTLRGNSKAPNESLSPKLDEFGAQMFGMQKFGQHWQHLTSTQQEEARQAWDHLEAQAGQPKQKRSVIAKIAMLNNWAEVQERDYLAARTAAAGLLTQKSQENDWRKTVYNPNEELPISAIMSEDKRTTWQYYTGGSTGYDNVRKNLEAALTDKDYPRASKILKDGGRELIADELRVTPVPETYTTYVKDSEANRVSYADALIRYGEAVEIRQELSAFQQQHVQPYLAALDTYQKTDLAGYEAARQTFAKRMKGLEDAGTLLVSTRDNLSQLRVYDADGTVSNVQVKSKPNAKMLSISLDDGKSWKEIEASEAMTGAVEDHITAIREAIGKVRLGEGSAPAADVKAQAMNEVKSLLGDQKLAHAAPAEAAKTMLSAPLPERGTGAELPA